MAYKPNDHRVIGPKLNLYQLSDDIGPGLPLIPWQGEIIIHELEKFLRSELEKRNYKFVRTPHLAKISLFKKSGHWDNYRENMFFTKSGNEELVVKPMNCPFHTTIFKQENHSYKTLPVRFAEFAAVYRDEKSGTLTGLSRVRIITQDDAHIYCTLQTLDNEIKELIELVTMVYDILGFKDTRIELSTRPEKYVGDLETWNDAENILKNTLKKRKIKYDLNPGDGAFYGPKIDFHTKDANGKSWQLATIQLDFNLCQRLGATYVNNEGKKGYPIILHRALLGSFERIFGILIEHYKGAFPFWMAPVQVKVLSFNDDMIDYSKKIEQKIRDAKIRVEGDYRPETVGAKVRDAELGKVPYIVVIGSKEKEKNVIAVRPRKDKPKFGVKLVDFLKQIKEEYENRVIK